MVNEWSLGAIGKSFVLGLALILLMHGAHSGNPRSKPINEQAPSSPSVCHHGISLPMDAAILVHHWERISCLQY